MASKKVETRGRKPGGPKSGGRQKGTENKITKRGKELLLQAIEGQMDYFQGAMDEVRQTDPAEWLRLLEKFSQYVLPRKKDITSDGKQMAPGIIIQRHADNTKASKNK